MLAAIHPVRVGAKHTFRTNADTDRANREAFFISEPTNVSIERLLSIAGELLRKLTPQSVATGGGRTTPPEFTLDGITPAA